MSDSLLIATAKRIPEGVRKVIVQEKFIDMAVNLGVENTPMQYLFDVYVEFIDRTLENEWRCNICRGKVLTDFKKLQPYLSELNN